MCLRWFVCCLVTVVSALALQSGWSTLGISEEAFRKTVRDYVLDSVRYLDSGLLTPGSSRAMTAAGYALSDSQRAALVTELGTAAKRIIMSPEFAKTYEDYIAKTQNAVNHGIQVTDKVADMKKAIESGDTGAMEDATANMMRDSMTQALMSQLEAAKEQTADTLPYSVDAAKTILEMIPPRNAAEKASQAKAKANLEEAAKMAKTDIAKARELFRGALMLGAGISDASEATSAKADRERQDQQQNYNRLLLRPALKKKLQEFIATARTVDFNAATQEKGGKKVFVNPSHERRDELWKMLYRLGPGGTKAAIAVAQGWIAEL